MTDRITTVGQLRAMVRRFVDDRDWQQFHAPKNLSMALSIEAAELMELFQWHGNEGSRVVATEPARRAALTDELADVLIYALALANATDIDVSEAVLAKLARNQVRFPPGKLPSRHSTQAGDLPAENTGTIP